VQIVFSFFLVKLSTTIHSVIDNLVKGERDQGNKDTKTDIYQTKIDRHKNKRTKS